MLMDTPEKEKQLQELQKTVDELKDFIERYFNSDGTQKNNVVIIEAEDTNTTPTGSIRVITSKGPRNILIT